MNKAAILGLVMLCGCMAYPASVGPVPTNEQERVLFLNFGNLIFVRLVDVIASRLPGGQLEVKAKLLSKALGNNWVDIKVEFRDSDGFELESTSWQPVLLRSEVVETYRTNGINARAVDFKLYVRNTR